MVVGAPSINSNALMKIDATCIEKKKFAETYEFLEQNYIRQYLGTIAKIEVISNETSIFTDL